MTPATMAKVRALEVLTPQGAAGRLTRESQYVFNYSAAKREQENRLGPCRCAHRVMRRTRCIRCSR